MFDVSLVVQFLHGVLPHIDDVARSSGSINSLVRLGFIPYQELRFYIISTSTCSFMVYIIDRLIRVAIMMIIDTYVIPSLVSNLPRHYINNV